MQDKIQEIMGLVEEYKDVAIGGFSGLDERMVIESKLRELVREPLTHELAWSIAVVSDNAMHAIRLAERAHGITNTSGVE